MEVEGIFRRSPNSALLRQAKEAYDRGTGPSMLKERFPWLTPYMTRPSSIVIILRGPTYCCGPLEEVLSRLAGADLPCDNISHRTADASFNAR